MTTLSPYLLDESALKVVAAFTELRERGKERVSVDEIAEEAGLKKCVALVLVGLLDMPRYLPIDLPMPPGVTS